MTNNIKPKTSNSKPLSGIINLLLGVLIIILVNVIAAYLFTRFDLTSEKRFTLSPATKNLVKKLDDVVFVKVYLEGDFPSGFKRLRNATKELLDEFRAYSKGNVEYEFINPSASTDTKERNRIYNQLAQKGLQPTNLEVKEGDASSQKIIFPGALLSYKGKEEPLQLLKSRIGAAPEEMLNNSVEALEFEIANTIRELTTVLKPKIAFIEGHEELDTMATADITRILSEHYEVERTKIIGKLLDTVQGGTLLNKLNEYKLVIIAKPDTAFAENEKFLLDQFIMHGGKVMWLLDAMNANMDSLAKTSTTVAISNNLNLDDQLFKYGVRVNPNLIMDLESAPIPMITGIVGNQPKTELVPWFFFPLLFSSSNHPIVNNLNAVRCEFVSSMDTIGNRNVKKTILLTSSKYSKVLFSPARISLGTAKQKPVMEQYNKHNLPVAVLLEGEFESNFRNRVPAALEQYKNIDFKEKSKFNKMLVVADGDIIKNQFNRSAGKYYELGYDRFTRETFGNKNFILNCIDYLLDDSGVIGSRSKELKLRLLDKTKITNEKLQWQLINTVVPILLLVVFGVLQFFLRKRKFAK